MARFADGLLIRMVVLSFFNHETVFVSNSNAVAKQ